MLSEGRVTRARAKLVGDATPLCAGLPDGTSGTRTTRRRAGAKEVEQPTPRVALFDLTNAEEVAPTAQAELPPVDETKPLELKEGPAAVEAAPAEASSVEDPLADAEQPGALEVETMEEVQEEASPVAEDSVPCVAHEASEEAPATPPHAPLPASPAHPVHAPTPTGLGLSNLAPMSPLGMHINLAANTPMATPLHGMPIAAEARVFDMLNAAAKAMEQHSKAAAEEAPEAALARGFGSPVKFSESPAMSVSFGGPEISLQGGMQPPEEGEEEVCSGSPAGASVGACSPAVGLNALAQATPAHKCPGLTQAAPGTPAEPVEVGEREADPVEEMSLELPGSQPIPGLEAAHPAAKLKLRSKVVVPSPNGFDPRSLRQLRKEIKEKAAENKAASAANSEEEEEEEGKEGEQYSEGAAGSSELLAAMGNLNLGSPQVPVGPYTLRGMPEPQGQHIRFEEDGTQYVSPKLKTMLRGLPTPHGKHQYFEDDE